jgi:hypothetical protein
LISPATLLLFLISFGSVLDLEERLFFASKPFLIEESARNKTISKAATERDMKAMVSII